MQDLALRIKGNSIVADLGPAGKVAGEFSLRVTEAELEDLTWYVESDASLMFGPGNDRASRVASSLKDFGGRLFDSLAGDSAVGAPLTEALEGADPRAIRLAIISPDPAILSLPWELGRCEANGGLLLAELGEIIRIPERARPPQPPAAREEDGPLRVLMVSPRPRRGADVPRAPTLGPVVTAAASYPESFSLQLVRPATVAAFERDLAVPGGYDVVHFDGHGVYGEDGETSLQFESTDGSPAVMTGTEFGALLATASPRVVLINACRSSYATSQSPSPSIAASVASELPDAIVIGMRFAVTPPLVEELLSTFYPHLVAGHNPSAAVAHTRHSLLGKWSSGDTQRGLASPPDFASLTVYRSDVADPDETFEPLAEDPLPSTDWRRTKIMSWWDDIEQLEVLTLRSTRPIVISGTIASGKTSLAEAFVEYGMVTGLFEEPPAIIDLPASRVDEIASDNRPAPPIFCVRGRPNSDPSALLRIPEPPMQLVAAAVEPTLVELRKQPSEKAEGTFFRFLSLAGAHLGTLKALVDAADAGGSAADLVECLEWGTTPDSRLRSAEVEEAFAALPPERQHVASVLGVFAGWVMPVHIATMTDGGLKVGNFERIFGRRVDAEEWKETFADLEGLGLVQGGSDLDRAAVRLPPIVGLALRERLRSWLSNDQALDDLQMDMVGATIGIANTFGDPNFWLEEGGTWWAARQNKRRVLHTLEANIARALTYTLRRGDDRLAIRLIAPYFRQSTAGSGTYQLGLSLASNYLRFELGRGTDCPHFRALVTAASSIAAESDEDWRKCLECAEGFLASGHDLKPDAGIPIMRVLIAQARAQWRLGSADAAEAILRRAAETSEGKEELEAVASAVDDLAQYRHLDDRARNELRARTGVESIPPSDLAEALKAEEEGDFGRAYDYWLAEIRLSEQLGDDVRSAFARTEIGRLCALHKVKVNEARRWLESALKMRLRLRLDVAAVLYYLGLAAEVDDSLEEAESWLLQAQRRSSEESNPSPGINADCVYELGLVQVRRNEGEKARKTLEEALHLYEDLELDEYRADTHWILAQLAQSAGNETRYLEHRNAALELGLELSSSRFVVAKVQKSESAPPEAAED